MAGIVPSVTYLGRRREPACPSRGTGSPGGCGGQPRTSCGVAEGSEPHSCTQKVFRGTECGPREDFP